MYKHDALVFSCKVTELTCVLINHTSDPHVSLLVPHVKSWGKIPHNNMYVETCGVRMVKYVNT